MIVYQDTREQQPFLFTMYDCTVIRKKLNTGDYSIENMENELCIDRKKNISELYGNLFRSWSRFSRELSRMISFKRAYILCEFPFDDVVYFPRNMISGKYYYDAEDIKTKIKLIEEDYGVRVVFNESRDEAEEMCFNILKDYYDKKKT